MSRRQASILVIAPFKNDERMYPHLHDILVNLRHHYDDVIYVGDDPGHQHHLEIDRLLDRLDFTNDQNDRQLLRKRIDDATHLFNQARSAFMEQLSRLTFKHQHHLVLAVDDNALNCAMRIFPNNIVYWSFDPLGRDSQIRLHANGFVEQMIRENAQQSDRVLALVAQDRERSEHLMHCMGTRFRKTIHIPVALNDSNFSRIDAIKRTHGGRPATIKVVQCGYIWAGRYSDDLVRSCQKWPDSFELHLRGDVGLDIQPLLSQSRSPVSVSQVFVDNSALPAMLSEYQVGFIGYRESDRNHHLIVNASSQLVLYLRSGMPVICSGSKQLIDFVNSHRIGIGIESPSRLTVRQMDELAECYCQFSANARHLYEQRYDLQKIMEHGFYDELDILMQQKESN